MKIIATLLAVFWVTGCATGKSSSTGAESSGDTPVEQAKPDDGVDSSSKVLNAKKCPRHSSLVNGKCVLDVESDQ